MIKRSYKLRLAGESVWVYFDDITTVYDESLGDIFNFDVDRKGNTSFNIDNGENGANIVIDANMNVNRIWGNINVGESTDYNSKYADAVEPLAGKPYILGEDGPDAYDCSGTACYGIRTVANSKFGDYTANDLFKKFTVKTTSRNRGVIIFYDYKSDGYIDHVTTILDSSNMLHPSSGKGILQIKPQTWLDNYTNSRGGTKYYREWNWQLIINY